MSLFWSRLPLASPVFDYFLGLKPERNKCQATYIWIDATGEHLRSKTRTLDRVPDSIDKYPEWNYDGSSTGQATGVNSDLYLRPVAVYPDPFNGGIARLVLCETFTHENKPTKWNNRNSCAEVMEAAKQTKPWFGIEQEYLLLDRDGHPLGWPKHGFPSPQGPYYCSVGATRAFGREVVEAHYRACLAAGITIAGANAEVAPGQWEFQVGPCEGVSIGDELWLARYILFRVAEQFGVDVTIDPKPPVTAIGEWNGAGCHTNFSTAAMRAKGGYKEIEAAMPRLERNHQKHMAAYDPNGGRDNLRRLTGRHETSTPDEFTWGVANRGCSVRVPRQVHADGCGYLEDRRPASNVDPYKVSEILVRTIVLEQ